MKNEIVIADAVLAGIDFLCAFTNFKKGKNKNAFEFLVLGLTLIILGITVFTC